MSARRLTLVVLVALCALVGALTLGGVTAQAAVLHDYLSRIAEVPAKGPPPTEEPVASPGPFDNVGGLAVNAGELYVLAGSSSGERIDKFNASTGAFIAQFPAFPTSSSPSLFDFHQGLAVGRGAGETEEYIAGDEDTGGETKGRVAVFDSTGSFQGVWNGSDTPGEHSFGCFECGGYGGVATDNSANPLTEGLVYVLDPLHDVVDVFEPKAGGAEKYVTQISGPEPGVPFVRLGEGSASSVAVDQQNGDVLVLDGSGAVDVFERAALGEYALVRRLTSTPSGSLERLKGVAVDSGNGDIYVLNERGVVDQFSAAGVYLGHLTGVGTPASAFGSLSGIAVDPATHDVYVDDQNEEGAFVDVFGPSIVVPDVTTEAASSIKARSATLNGTVNPDKAGAATCRFEWGTSTSLGKVAPCEPEGVAEGASPVAVHAALSLQPDMTYYYRLQASNAQGSNPGEAFQDREFSTPGAGIHQESAAAVTSASASLDAEIDPDNTPTTYYFQYGTSLSYGASVPAPPGLSLGFGKGDVAVSIHLQGLASATTYHYRVVAISEPNGEPLTSEGPDQTFTTQAAGTELTQPDARAWEMVSPPSKQGASINALDAEQGGDIQASAEGNGITYTATAPFVANPAGNRASEATQVISTRSAPGSWVTSDISLPHNNGSTAVRVGNQTEYKLFSSDLSLGLVEPPDDTPLPPLPADAERTLYLRGANDAYKALVTSTNVPAGTQFGNEEDGAPVWFLGASPDLSHDVLASEVKLTATPRPAGAGAMLYEWAEGQLKTVSILPDREPTAARLGLGGTIVRHAVSNDGSRVIWEVGGNLYLRDMAKGETVEIDAAQGAPEPSQVFSRYKTADAEGSRVFFTSANRLTAAASASNRGEDLYEFEVTSGSGEPLAGKLTDLSVDENTRESAAVQGVIGASEDGSYVYFVAHGVLGDAAEHGATSGDNLYVEHYEEETRAWTAPKFIGALSEEDSASWGGGSTSTNLTEMTSRVSPSGRYLTFMSEMSLTGYENRDANSDEPDEEVFLYDAGTDRLVCASCNPTGARPVGLLMSGKYEANLVDYDRFAWQTHWLAANIPAWTSTGLLNALSQSRYLSDSGRLFFNSSDALVPADVNGTEDVYEYEPAGVGSCKPPDYGESATVVFSASVDGCVGLISSGTSSEESAFIDASETGGDVFFLTLSRLAPQDQDTSIDLYDAHECTAAAPCAPAQPLTPPPCTTGDACKPSPTPQPTLFGEPASQTFSGAGNIAPSLTTTVKPKAKPLSRAQKLAKALKACKKEPKSRRTRCDRQSKKRYGSAHKAHKTDRRAK